MKQQQSGFTLIELIMVIVILGILAATAIPKFADLSNDAHRANVAAAVGALRSAVVIDHSVWQARGSLAGTAILGTAIIIDGVSVGFGSTGFPADNAAPTQAGSVPTMTAATCANAWNAIMNVGGLQAAAAAGAGVDFVTTVASPVCTFTYNVNGAAPAITRSFDYNATTGVVNTIVNP